MEEYIDKIDRFLRGQMTEKEEQNFKNELPTNSHLHSFALLIASILKALRKKTEFLGTSFFFMYLCIRERNSFIF